MLKDNFGRTISYMRVSVTDRCNLRCFYCWPKKHAPFIPHEDILRYEEILRLIRIGRTLGVHKIRLTGGEPFVRRDFLPFLEQALKQHPDIDLRLTTNGTVLPGRIRELRAMGVKVLNISLDTLQRAKFERITGKDEFFSVRRAIDECLESDIRVKINAVALKGINSTEVADFLRFGQECGIDVRFIEFMPIGRKTIWTEENFWPAGDIIAEASRHADLIPSTSCEPNSGPAKVYKIGNSSGKFGIISAVSDHFCSKCNRLRITPDGKLRTCLFSDTEYRLRQLLRSPKLDDARVAEVLRRANMAKPMGYMQLKQRTEKAVCQRDMSAIGG